jgi:hypothetical protein
LATCNLLGCLNLCCLLCSLLISLASQILILKGPFRGKPEVPLASSRTSTLVTMRIRSRVTYERSREKSMGLRTHKSKKRPKKNIERN